jgi:uncharacterized protein (DUF2267 family)
VKYDDMIRTIAGRTGLVRRRADEVLVATLTVLSEAISANETRDLLAQLPKSLRTRVPVSSTRLEMRPAEFVGRVADLLVDVTMDQAETYVHAVFATLVEAVNTGEMNDIAEELGPEFAPLLGRQPTDARVRADAAALALVGKALNVARELPGRLVGVLRRVRAVGPLGPGASAG